MDDKLTRTLVRTASGLFIVAVVGTAGYFAWRHVAKGMAGRYCAQVDVPARCPEGAECSQQMKLAVFADCMAEKGFPFR